jgi:lipopolysaccharide export system protein LptC
MRLLRPTFALILLVVLFAGTWMLLPAPEPVPDRAAPDGTRTVDYTIKGLEVTSMMPAGIPAHRLYAPSLRHYADDGTSAIDQPRLTVFQDDAPPWEIRAEDALVSTDGELVLLRGEVLIEREAGPDNRPLRLVTRELRVQPRQDYAETDAAVRVDSDPDWLEAVGMQAWLRPPSRLKLLSQVNGYHVPR